MLQQQLLLPCAGLCYSVCSNGNPCASVTWLLLRAACSATAWLGMTVFAWAHHASCWSLYSPHANRGKIGPPPPPDRLSLAGKYVGITQYTSQQCICNTKVPPPVQLCSHFAAHAWAQHMLSDGAISGGGRCQLRQRCTITTHGARLAAVAACGTPSSSVGEGQMAEAVDHSMLEVKLVMCCCRHTMMRRMSRI